MGFRAYLSAQTLSFPKVKIKNLLTIQSFIDLIEITKISFMGGPEIFSPETSRPESFSRRAWLVGGGTVIGTSVGAAVESRLEQPHSFDDAVVEAMENSREIFNHSFEKNSSLPASIYTSTSRFEKIKELVYASSLPLKVKNLAPYLPFIFSGYQPEMKKEDKEKGLWNFNKLRAKQMGLMSEDEKIDKRASLKETTKAAITHLQRICTALQQDPHYQKLCKINGIPADDNRLLAFATVSSFCPHGDIIVKNALKKLVDDMDGSVANDDDLATKLAIIVEDFDGHSDVTEEDRKFMASLPFNALALQNLHKQRTPAPQTDVTIRKWVGKAIAGLAPVFSSLLGGPTDDGRAISRRSFFLGGAAALAEWPLARVVGEKNFTPTAFNFDQMPAISIPKEGELRLFEPQIREAYLKASGNPSNRLHFIKTLGFSLFSPSLASAPSDYYISRLMGEASYDLFEEKSDSRYLALAHYYFHHCQHLRPRGEESAFLERAVTVTGGKTSRAEASVVR